MYVCRTCCNLVHQRVTCSAVCTCRYSCTYCHDDCTIDPTAYALHITHAAGIDSMAAGVMLGCGDMTDIQALSHDDSLSMHDCNYRQYAFLFVYARHNVSNDSVVSQAQLCTSDAKLWPVVTSNMILCVNQRDTIYLGSTDAEWLSS